MEYITYSNNPFRTFLVKTKLGACENDCLISRDIFNTNYRGQEKQGVHI